MKKSAALHSAHTRLHTISRERGIKVDLYIDGFEVWYWGVLVYTFELEFCVLLKRSDMRTHARTHAHTQTQRGKGRKLWQAGAWKREEKGGQRIYRKGGTQERRVEEERVKMRRKMGGETDANKAKAKRKV